MSAHVFDRVGGPGFAPAFGPLYRAALMARLRLAAGMIMLGCGVAGPLAAAVLLAASSTPLGHLLHGAFSLPAG